MELRVIAAWSWILLILLHYLAKFGDDDDDDDDYDDDDLWTNGDDNDYDHDDYQNSLKDGFPRIIITVWMMISVLAKMQGS